MNQDLLINKVLRDLKQFGLINEEDSGKVKFHLNLLCTAIWEGARKELLNHNSKPVTQFNRKGEIIAEYPSIKEAAKFNHCHRAVIDEAIACGRITEKGHIWKHKEHATS
jgi:hypothetical protein